MKRANLLFVIVFVLGSFVINAQELNSKLMVKFDAETLENMKANNSMQYELLNYFVENGFYVIDMPEKPIEYIELKKINPLTGMIVNDYNVSLSDLTDFNPLEYNCMFEDYKNRYYKVGTTGKLIVVHAAANMNIAIENQNRLNKNKK